MRSPRDMQVIEIDITNACIHSCSNCTRFCGHHKRPFFMTFEDFKRAVDSLDDFYGMVGVMGGEPTLHPELEKFADYIREKRVKKKERIARGPISDMQANILATVDRADSKVLFLSSISSGYYKHFEVINDTFSRQLLNDHRNEVMHQALLMSRKELGISDEEWKKKRDSCWVQNAWSATITPKGAFFCEVAGALDMLFDGPGGWPVESGWINRTPAEFGDQLYWCEMCSACLDAPKRLSNDERDDVTPKIYKKLLEIGSPKAKNGKCVVRDPLEYEEYREKTYVSGNEYMEVAEDQRFGEGNGSLSPKLIVFPEEKQGKYDLSGLREGDWIAVGGAADKDRIEVLLYDYIWNPGCLYVIDEKTILVHPLARSIRDKIDNPLSVEELMDAYPEDKKVFLDSEDPYLCVLGGDLEWQWKKFNRKGKRLLVFGAGEVGSLIVGLLEKKGISDFEIVVTNPSNNRKEICGHMVRRIDEFMEKRDDVVVLIASKPINHRNMRDCLREKGFLNYRYVMQSIFIGDVE